MSVCVCFCRNCDAARVLYRYCFTIRTTAEGGELTISFEQYIHTLQVAAQSECVDYIDVEMFWWDRALSESESVTEGTIREAVQALQQHVQVIGSYHDFQGTPQEMQITKRLLAMHENGADIPKMAVMPAEKRGCVDVNVCNAAGEETDTGHTGYYYVDGRTRGSQPRSRC